MKTQPSELHWLDAGMLIDIQELGRCCRLGVDEIEELVDYGALERADAGTGALVFSSDCVAPLRVASKLRLAFDLDLFTMGLLLRYLRRIDTLEGQVSSLQARLPAHLAPAA